MSNMPFIGFTYGGIHSSTLGIVRTSDGSRFSENLLPTQQNRTVNIPGRDETFYFGSDNTQKQFNIQFAFDSVDDDKLDRIRAWLGNKAVRDLVFDERDTVTWRAKVTSSSIKYLPFEGKDGGTVYKGEGSIQFTCYEPYGIQKVRIDIPDTENNKRKANIITNFYQPADWKILLVFFGGGGAKINTKISLKDSKNEEVLFTFTIRVTSSDLISDNETTDVGIIIDSKTGQVEGVYSNGSEYERSGHIYSHLLDGKFSKIPASFDGFFEFVSKTDGAPVFNKTGNYIEYTGKCY